MVIDATYLRAVTCTRDWQHSYIAVPARRATTPF